MNKDAKGFLARHVLEPLRGRNAPWQALTKALFDDYRPELHYMRGPGPKWRQKHDGAEMDRASPTVTKALIAGLRP